MCSTAVCGSNHFRPPSRMSHNSLMLFDGFSLHLRDK